MLSAQLAALFAALLVTNVSEVFAADTVQLSDSIREFSRDVTVIGQASSQESIKFSIALKLRDLDALRKKIGDGKILSAAELENRHLPLSQDYEKLISWLKSSGLSVEQTYPNRLVVIASGRIAQVRELLGVDFARVRVQGKEYTAARTAPRIPGEFSRFVLGINGLQPYQKAVALHHKQQVQSPTQPFVPPFSINDILTAYSGTSLGLNGSGQTIAILIDVFPAKSDLNTFWANQSIPASTRNFKLIKASDVPTPDAQSGEETLDSELTSGIAPAAKIRIYGSGDLFFTSLDQALQKLIADLPSQPTLRQLSISLGACEQDVSSSQKQTDSQLLATIAASGVSIFVSSGDDGSANLCSSGLGVSYYASDPSVTAVGGTALTLTSAGAVSKEVAWNDIYGSTGGGISSFFSRPSWQVGAGVPAGTTRLVPDVALDGAVTTGVYVIFQGSTFQFGGTSVSAPLWAGFSALVNQARASAAKAPLGLLNPYLYPLLGTSNFRDITRGSNGAYRAGAGYDLTTGIGVPVLSVLVNTLFNLP